jgi:hypothetical protein
VIAVFTALVPVWPGTGYVNVLVLEPDPPLNQDNGKAGFDEAFSKDGFGTRLGPAADAGSEIAATKNKLTAASMMNDFIFISSNLKISYKKESDVLPEFNLERAWIHADAIVGREGRKAQTTSAPLQRSAERFVECHPIGTDAGNHRSVFICIYRFDEIAVHAQPVTLLEILHLLRGGHYDYRERLESCIALDAFQYFNPAYFRQFQVEQDETETVIGLVPGIGAGIEDIIERFRTVLYPKHFAAWIALPQHPQGELGVV